jgi:radical SAM-linked protein
MSATKIRLRFTKSGDLRLISHHDLMRCLERMLRRAAVPVAHSQGFNPRPKLTFPLALALGIEGRSEVLDLELVEPLNPADLRDRLAAVAPEGLQFLEAEAVGPGRSPQVSTVAYALDLPEERVEATRVALVEFLASTTWPYSRHRPDRDRTIGIDLRPFLLTAELGRDRTLRFRLRMTPNGSARPEELVDALGLRDLLNSGTILVRTEVELARAEIPATTRPLPEPAIASSSSILLNTTPHQQPSPEIQPWADDLGTESER